MSEVIELLKKSGYPSKAIEYYVGKVNVGEIEDPMFILRTLVHVVTLWKSS